MVYYFSPSVQESGTLYWIVLQGDGAHMFLKCVHSFNILHVALIKLHVNQSIVRVPMIICDQIKRTSLWTLPCCFIDGESYTVCMFPPLGLGSFKNMNLKDFAKVLLPFEMMIGLSKSDWHRISRGWASIGIRLHRLLWFSSECLLYGIT